MPFYGGFIVFFMQPYVCTTFLSDVCTSHRTTGGGGGTHTVTKCTEEQMFALTGLDAWPEVGLLCCLHHAPSNLCRFFFSPGQTKVYKFCEITWITSLNELITDKTLQAL